MERTQHTAIPYYVGVQNDAIYIVVGERPSPSNDYPRHDANREAIAHVYSADDAAFIVKACNSHEKLLSLIASAELAIKALDDTGFYADFREQLRAAKATP